MATNKPFTNPFHQAKLKIKTVSSDMKPTTVTTILSVFFLLNTAKAGERLKRELRFPKGGSFAAAVALASFLPKGPTEGLAHVLEFDLGFPFPEKFSIGKRISSMKSRGKRNTIEQEKLNLLFKIEDAITRIGFNGSACALRFQCELKNIPTENSLLEELLFALFKTNFELSVDQCQMHHRHCPISLLQVIYHSEQISASHMS